MLIYPEIGYSVRLTLVLLQVHDDHYLLKPTDPTIV